MDSKPDIYNLASKYSDSTISPHPPLPETNIISATPTGNSMVYKKLTL